MVAAGVTDLKVSPVTSPTLPKLRLVPPVTDHDSVALSPETMLAGLALKLVMTGAARGGGVVEPPPPPQAKPRDRATTGRRVNRRSDNMAIPS